MSEEKETEMPHKFVELTVYLDVHRYERGMKMPDGFDLVDESDAEGDSIYLQYEDNWVDASPGDYLVIAWVPRPKRNNEDGRRELKVLHQTVTTKEMFEEQYPVKIEFPTD